MRTICALLLAAMAAGCGRSTADASDTSSRGARTAASCLGGATPSIDVGMVGSLPLSLPVRELRARCGEIRDTFAHFTESRDTAIVISQSGLSVIGRLATTADEEGEHPFKLDSAMTIDRWTVTGANGLLPGGVPLSAPWDSLVRAYGTPRLIPLNGDVMVWFCDRLPTFTFHFDDPYYRTKSQPPSRSARLARSTIRSVDIPGRAGLRPSPACNA